MNYLRKVVDWIVSLESGQQFRKWISILVKIFGVLTLIGAVIAGIAIFVGVIATIRYLGAGSGTLAVIGSILSFCINVIIGTLIVLLCWNRANKIGDLGSESHFSLIPMTVVLIRLSGEVGFIFLIGTGIQGLVGSILGSGIMRGMGGLYSLLLPDLLELFREIGFIGGLFSFVVCVFSGVVHLIVTYFLAELVNLFADMATNLKKIEGRLSAAEDTSDS